MFPVYSRRKFIFAEEINIRRMFHTSTFDVSSICEHFFADALAICLLVDLCDNCSNVILALYIICHGSATRSAGSPLQPPGSHPEVCFEDSFSAVDTKLPSEEVV